MTAPLVSVNVCTYNSSKTVIETLESIKQQTYQKIELIVSDDCSKDNTVNLCNKWIIHNKSRFVRTLVITHSTNTGTSANVNRARSACQGEWVKGIGADDKLLPNCIEDFVKYINEHPNANIIFSKVVGFGNMEAAGKWPWLNIKKYFDAFTPKQFRIILSTQNFLPAPSVFYRKSVWVNLGGYDESIPLIEDWPFWVKSLTYGYVFNFLDKETVAYRFSELSVSQGNLSDRYLDSNWKTVSYVRKSLMRINFLYYYLYQSRRLYRWKNPAIKLLVHFVNLFNPAYYEYNRTLLLFKELSGLI